MYKKAIFSIIALLFAMNLTTNKSFAFMDIKHYRTMDITEFKGNCSNFRSAVMTIGKYYKSSSITGTVQQRIFATAEDVKSCYPNGAYPTEIVSRVNAMDKNLDRTGSVGSYSPEASGGNSISLPDVVFNWKDWGSVTNLAVKVVSNGFTTVVTTSQPNGNTSSREIVVTRSLGLGSQVSLPKSVSTSSADKSVQTSKLGFVTEFNLDLDDEFSTARSIGHVKYNVIDSFGDVIPLKGSHITSDFYYLW